MGYDIIDATCPMVKEIHRIARDMESNGYSIIIIGDPQHDEVRGIAGQLKSKPLVIDNPENIPIAKVKQIKKACVVVQSTQKLENVLKVVGILRKYVKGLKFSNTICAPTRIKQTEIKNMPVKNDLMIIIGSKESANTKRLYEISKSLNKKSYWIESTKDIKDTWFKGIKSVGITAGASTPDETTQEVIKYINNLP
jgi:4-hydroxy-3-methylbut-2-enyl diphosphate reductase